MKEPRRGKAKYKKYKSNGKQNMEKEMLGKEQKMAGEESEYNVKLQKIYEKYKNIIEEKGIGRNIEPGNTEEQEPGDVMRENGGNPETAELQDAGETESTMQLAEVIDLGISLQEEMWKLNVQFGLWDDSRGYDHDAIYYVAEFLHRYRHMWHDFPPGHWNPDSEKALLADLLFQAIDRKNKKRIHVLEPYPGDMLGSASGICYSPGISLMLHTMCSVKDGKNSAGLEENDCKGYESVHKQLNVDKQFQYQVEDYPDDACMNSGETDYEALVCKYEEKYGKEGLKKLRQCVQKSIRCAGDEDGYLVFPLGISHPMYRLTAYECVKQIKKTGFSREKIIIYVEHPYDYESVGTGRIQKAKEYIQQELELPLCRCDDLSVDQSVLADIIRGIYGEERYEKFAGTLERTYCSYFVNYKAVHMVKKFLKIHVNNILFITTQAKPFLKTGGMGEVAYALCKTLKDFVNDVRIMMPKYSENMGFSMDAGSKRKGSWKFDYWGNEDTVGNLSCEVIKMKYEGLVYYLLDIEGYFDEENLDDLKNYGKELAVFSDILIGKGLHTIDYMPSILHCNDWQTGLIPMLKKTKYHYYRPELKVIYTIHFYGYKGIFKRDDILEYVGLKNGKCRLCISCGDDCPFCRSDFLPREEIRRLGIEPSQMSFMKAGIEFADIVTTVSKGYARELQGYPDFSNVKVAGIRNGISQKKYQFSDISGFCEVSESNFREAKGQNKNSLQRKLNLENDLSVPLICIVSRLAADKGIEVVKSIIKEILEIPAQLVIIGDDEDKRIRPYESFFKIIEKENYGRFAYRNFSEELEYETYAGSDIFLMPSLKEACGTTQMNSMQYGVVPIVSMLDSFQDTVIDFEDRKKENGLPYRNRGIGFYAYRDDCWVLLEVIKKAVKIYRNEDGLGTWDEIAKECIKADFGWKNKSVKEYLMLYNGADFHLVSP